MLTFATHLPSTSDEPAGHSIDTCFCTHLAPSHAAPSGHTTGPSSLRSPIRSGTSHRSLAFALCWASLHASAFPSSASRSALASVDAPARTRSSPLTSAKPPA